MVDFDYIENRLDPQISWYEDRSGKNKSAFNLLSNSAFVAAASIPVLALFIEPSMYRLIAGLLGFVVTVLVGLLAHYKPQEKWLHYRTTCETLKQHRYRFLTRTNPYQSGSLSVLVEHCEILISSENTDWESLVLSSSSDVSPENGA